MQHKSFIKFITEVKAVGPNTKTIKSIDVDTVCPRKEYVEFDCKSPAEKKKFLEKLEAEKKGAAQEFLDNLEKAKKQGNWKECAYCYVKGARDKGENFFLAKKVHTDTEYSSSNILKMPQKTVDKLNAVGGIRLFSHSDYKTRKHDIIKQILDDAAKRGLNVKVITKVPQFVEDFANHPALKLINVSVDTIGSGMDHKTALAFKQKYPKKVRIRAVITNPRDLLDPIMDHVDVFTFYHGSSKKLKELGFTNFSGKDREAIGAGTYEYKPSKPSKKEMTEAKDYEPSEEEQELARKINARIKQLNLKDKTCCVGSHCSKCKLKCGAAGCDTGSSLAESKFVDYLAKDNLFEMFMEDYLCDFLKFELNESSKQEYDVDVDITYVPGSEEFEVDVVKATDEDGNKVKDKTILGNIEDALYTSLKSKIEEIINDNYAEMRDNEDVPKGWKPKGKQHVSTSFSVKI